MKGMNDLNSFLSVRHKKKNMILKYFKVLSIELYSPSHANEATVDIRGDRNKIYKR